MLYKDHELINLIKPENEREGALVLEDEKHENNIILEVSGKTYEVSTQICVLLKELLYIAESKVLGLTVMAGYQFLTKILHKSFLSIL